MLRKLWIARDHWPAARAEKCDLLLYAFEKDEEMTAMDTKRLLEARERQFCAVQALFQKFSGASRMRGRVHYWTQDRVQ